MPETNKLHVITPQYNLNLKALYLYKRKNSGAMANDSTLSFLVNHDFVDFSPNLNLWEDNTFPLTKYSNEAAADFTRSSIA